MCGIQSLILSHSWSPPNSDGPINNSRNFAQPGLESLLPFAGLPSTRVRSSPRRVILFDCFTSEALSCFQTHRTAADLRTCVCGTPKAWLSWVVHTVYLNCCAGRARFLITRTIPSERSRPLALSHFPTVVSPRRGGAEAAKRLFLYFFHYIQILFQHRNTEASVPATDFISGATLERLRSWPGHGAGTRGRGLFTFSKTRI